MKELGWQLSTETGMLLFFKKVHSENKQKKWNVKMGGEVLLKKTPYHKKITPKWLDKQKTLESQEMGGEKGDCTLGMQCDTASVAGAVLSIIQVTGDSAEGTLSRHASSHLRPVEMINMQ